MTRQLQEETPSWTDYFLSWHNLDRILGSRALKPLYFWLFAIPIVARVLADLPEKLQIKIVPEFSVVYLNFDIPFNWKLLYFAALAFALSRSLYVLFCPDFVRNHTGAQTVIAAGVTVQHIRSVAADFLRKCYKRKLPEYDTVEGRSLKLLLKQYHANIDDIDMQWKKGIIRQLAVGDLLFDALERVLFKSSNSDNYEFSERGTYSDITSATSINREQLLKHLSWDLIKLQNASYPKLRGAITAFSLLSFILLAIPFFQSVFFVLRLLIH